MKTYRLMVERFDENGYQLLLRLNESNQTMMLWSDVSYAACKTQAAAIFKATFTWNDTSMQTQDVVNLATGV